MQSMRFLAGDIIVAAMVYGHRMIRCHSTKYVRLMKKPDLLLRRRMIRYRHRCHWASRAALPCSPHICFGLASKCSYYCPCERNPPVTGTNGQVIRPWTPYSDEKRTLWWEVESPYLVGALEFWAKELGSTIYRAREWALTAQQPTLERKAMLSKVWYIYDIHYIVGLYGMNAGWNYSSSC